MKKKILKAISLTLALLMFAVLAIGSGSSTESTASESSTAAASVSESVASTVEETESTEKTSSSVYTLTEETIVDNEYCVFKITDVEEDNIWGTTFNVYLENKTADKTLMFSLDNVSVNGYMCDPFWATEVAAGKKANSEISFSTSTLEECGIDSMDVVEFELLIYDSDDWSAEHIVDDIFTVYPTGLSADQINTAERETSANETVIVDNDYCTFTILGTSYDSIWGYALNCYIENKADYPIMVSWDDVSVNGYMCDPFWATEIAAGMKSYSDITFYDTSLEEIGITDTEAIESIEFELRVTNSEDWSANGLVDEVFTYNP